MLNTRLISSTLTGLLSLLQQQMFPSGVCVSGVCVRVWLLQASNPKRS